MPARFEKLALHTAAATLPRAMAVKAIELCTVEGSRVRNSMPAPSIGSTPGKARAARPSSGKARKVIAMTARCSRQLRAPATMASRDSRAPWRKNSAKIAAAVTALANVAHAPRAGSTVASAIAPSSART